MSPSASAKSAGGALARGFDLDSYGLDVSTVIVNGRTAAFSQEDHELVVTPRKTVFRGTSFQVQVRYKADPRRLNPPLGGFVATPDGFSTAPQPHAVHTIFPSNDHPSDKARYTFKVTAPAGTIGIDVKTGNHPHRKAHQSSAPTPGTP